MSHIRASNGFPNNPCVSNWKMRSPQNWKNRKKLFFGDNIESAPTQKDAGPICLRELKWFRPINRACDKAINVIL